MNEILTIAREIWALPWYKVLLIAILDDMIFIIKMWPVILGLLFAQLFIPSLLKMINKKIRGM
jgi:hypothetical protein